MFQKITVLIDGPIQHWIEQQGRKFKISKFVRDLLQHYIEQQEKEEHT